MGNDDAKVNVRLDTSQAKGELRGLNRLAAGRASNRVGRGLRFVGAATPRVVGKVPMSSEGFHRDVSKLMVEARRESKERLRQMEKECWRELREREAAARHEETNRLLRIVACRLDTQGDGQLPAPSTTLDRRTVAAELPAVVALRELGGRATIQETASHLNRDGVRLGNDAVRKQFDKGVKAGIVIRPPEGTRKGHYQLIEREQGEEA